MRAESRTARAGCVGKLQELGSDRCDTQRSLLRVSDLLLRKDRILDLLPRQMAEVTKLDAEYHSGTGEIWIEKHQLDTERNLFFHRQVIDEVCRNIQDQSVILELGGGVGFDASLFMQRNLPFKCYILSEISRSLLEYARRANNASLNGRVVFCCVDANQIMIEADQADVVFMVAALHHVPSLCGSIAEIDRVSKANSRIVFGIEPNFLWEGLVIRLRPFYRKLLARTCHSAADEEAKGFTVGDFQKIAADRGWILERIIPVWFFTGFLHYGLEGVFRLLRLRKRIRVPGAVERMSLALDRLFFLLPCADRLAWHYTVSFRKAQGGGR